MTTDLRLNPDDYLAQLQALLPPGTAWPTDPDAVLTLLLAGLALGMARAHNRMADLVDESDPRKTYELLVEWETELGLPDTCLQGIDQTVAQRRAAVLAKLLAQGGQSPAYFVALAETLGYPGCTVTEFSEFTCEGACEDHLYDTPWLYTWMLNAPQTQILDFDTESTCEEPLRSWGDELLECVMHRLKPGHSTLHITYGA
ncbi:MAG: DUF2313 domain-containing protein [Alphaproteobacteria bacterium]|nr:DUF2313 domain-containing protein [Alphaproteobacteria bacterium]